MKKFICLFIFLACCSAFSQSLSIFDVDTTNFPTLKAKFFAFDKDGNQITNLNPSDFELKENGQLRTVTNISCPAPMPPVALSSVLVFDVSGSMTGAPLDMEKAVANTWINMLPLGNSDCAITSFSNNNYINQDFTTNKNKLINGINSLGIIGGTDYNAAMIDPAAGGILMAKTGKHKRIIIFLTDGQPNFEPRTQEIIDEAKKNNITIYCLSMYRPAHHSMIEFSNQTGGLYFENIKSKEEAEETMRKIYELDHNQEPCEIKWQSIVSCVAGITNVELLITNLSITTTTYQSPNTSIAKLEFNPSYVKFLNPEIGVKTVEKVTVTARNADFTVTNITCNNTVMTIVPSSFVLNKGQSIELTVSYLPTDSGYVFARFDLENDLCPTKYYVTGGFSGIKPKIKTLKLLHPNGGEEFVIGSNTIITWEGIPESDTIKLEYTIDNGMIWKAITDKASGLQYKWKNIPKPPSSKCKVRIKHSINPSGTENAGDLLHTLSGHTNDVYAVNWSSDGSRVATTSWDKTARIWDVKTGTVLHILSGHTDFVYSLNWSPNGFRVATASWDNTARIWDAESGIPLQILSGHTNDVFNVSWSPDGTRVATASGDKTARIWDASNGAILHTLSGHSDIVFAVSWSPDGSRLATASWDNTVRIWDAKSGASLHRLSGHNSSVADVNWSPDGTRVATASGDNSARIWDAETGTTIHTLSGHTDDVYAVKWSPDGTKIVTASDDMTARIWNVATGDMLHRLSGHTGEVRAVIWNPDGSLVASAGGDRTARIWDAASGNTLYTLSGHTGYVWKVNWSPDGTRLATASMDSTAKIWFVGGGNTIMQEDQSDSVFSIVAPQASANNIDMKECLVGMIKDSVITDVIENTGSYPVRIDSIYFTGADALNFRLLSHILPQTIQPGDKISLEFGFGPGRIGLHSAGMIILTQADTLFKKIIGTGFEPQLAVKAKIIDFGQLEIGKERTFTDTALVKNISLSPITINNVIQMGPDKTQFEILSSLTSFTLQPGEEKKLTLKFKPIYGGRTTGQIAFVYKGVGSPVIVGLFGTGIGGNLRIAKDSAYAGESRNLKLIMEKAKPEGISALAPNFEATIRFQNTILAPINNPNWNISSDSTYLKISGKFATSNDIAQIPVIAGLGNVDETAIDIVDFVLKDDSGNKVDYDFEFESGTFSLLGICYEGGARLINPNNKVELLQISPNPNDGNLALGLNLIEEGFSTLSIYNSNGQLMYEKNISGSTGKIDLNIDTKEYGNGLYFVSLQTPTIRKVKQMVVFKCK